MNAYSVACHNRNYLEYYEHHVRLLFIENVCKKRKSRERNEGKIEQVGALSVYYVAADTFV